MDDSTSTQGRTAAAEALFRKPSESTKRTPRVLQIDPPVRDVPPADEKTTVAAVAIGQVPETHAEATSSAPAAETPYASANIHENTKKQLAALPFNPLLLLKIQDALPGLTKRMREGLADFTYLGELLQRTKKSIDLSQGTVEGVEKEAQKLDPEFRFRIKIKSWPEGRKLKRLSEGQTILWMESQGLVPPARPVAEEPTRRTRRARTTPASASSSAEQDSNTQFAFTTAALEIVQRLGELERQHPLAYDLVVRVAERNPSELNDDDLNELFVSKRDAATDLKFGLDFLAPNNLQPKAGQTIAHAQQAIFAAVKIAAQIDPSRRADFVVLANMFDITAKSQTTVKAYDVLRQRLPHVRRKLDAEIASVCDRANGVLEPIQAALEPVFQAPTQTRVRGRQSTVALANS